VTIQGFKFEPSSATAAAGGKVTWTNKDDAPHTVTFDDASVTSSGNLTKDQTFEATFANAGTFAYKCNIHPTMTGQVTVS
jgi:plastocyanin